MKLETYHCPQMGDLVYDFVSDLYKCQYWAKQLDPRKNAERDELMNAYFEFVVDNKSQLEIGNYQTIESRPLITFKEPLTQEIVALNTPDLSKDEELKQNVVDDIDVGLSKLV